MPSGFGALEGPFPALDGVRHRFVQLPGLRVHVAEAGAGEPLVLLHGFPQHWWGWRKVLPALAEHYRVIAPDLRGAGWTEAPRHGYTEEQLVSDVIGLLDALEVHRGQLVRARRELDKEPLQFIEQLSEADIAGIGCRLTIDSIRGEHFLGVFALRG